MNGWTDTLLTSFFIALVPAMTLAGTLDPTAKTAYIVCVTFVGTFAGAVLQHRRQSPSQKQAVEGPIEKEKSQ